MGVVCGKVVSFLVEFRIFCYSAKNACKKANKGFALNPLRSLRPFMAVGVVRLRVSYAKETWVSLAGGFFGIAVRFLFLRDGSKLGVGARF